MVVRAQNTSVFCLLSVDCLFCLIGPFFVLLTCEIDVYLQVYIHFLTARGRLKSLKCSQVMGTHAASKWRQDGADVGRIVAV